MRALKAAWARAGRVWAERGSDVAGDVIGLFGAGALAYGAHEVYRPAGFIVGGVLLIVGRFLAAKGKA